MILCDVFNNLCLFNTSKKNCKIEVHFSMTELNHINNQTIKQNNKQNNNGIIETITHNRQIERTS